MLMKDATQKTPHESAVFLHLYRLFSGGKVRKNAFSGNQFFYARGDILEMQQSALMDWCDLNTEAKKRMKNKKAGRRSAPHVGENGGLFISPVLMLLSPRLSIIP